MTIAVAGSTFDCRNARVVAEFWAGVLGYDVAWADEQGALIRDPAGTGPWIGFTQVPEGKEAKNRFHMDLESEDLMAEITRVQALGATSLSEHRESFWDWNVMADPEGNEFCLGRVLQR
jgi:hypothetical protein